MIVFIRENIFILGTADVQSINESALYSRRAFSNAVASVISAAITYSEERYSVAIWTKIKL